FPLYGRSSSHLSWLSRFFWPWRRINLFLLFNRLVGLSKCVLHQSQLLILLSLSASHILVPVFSSIPDFGRNTQY
ncbi:unnamed protein product, partial [Musa acuminata var. zebrina]